MLLESIRHIKRIVVNSFFHKLMANRSLPIFGAPTRDFIYVGDLVNGLLAATSREITAGEIFHLCSGRETSVVELANAMSKKMGKPNARIIGHPARAGEVERTFASSEKARQLLGFKCTTDILTALDTTVDWLVKYYTKIVF